MDLIASWIVYPAVLLVLCTGCGLLLEYVTFRPPPQASPSGGGRVRRQTIPSALLPATGLAMLIVVAQFLTLADATAELATPAAVGLAVGGFALGARGRALGAAAWPLAVAAAVFGVYAAPIVLSGEATIAGFIKLDDTATWLALTDHALEHGRDLDGLAPSTYEATLHFNLGDGYPIGVFLPFGIASHLIGIDVAWSIQPYMACLAALLALALWTVARPLAAAPPLRAAAALVGALPALLFGYYLWGGVKELAAAALIATVAALAVRLGDRPASWGALLAPAVAAAALVGVLSAGAGVWLVPVLVGAAALLRRALGAAAIAVRTAALTCVVAFLSMPVIVAGALLPPTSSPLTDDGARGNLAAPLEPAQVAGIWPAGDFRFDPGAETITYALIAIACAVAAGGLVWCWRRREPGLTVYVLGVLAGSAVLVAIGSPWVEGKALATASSAIPFAAMVGVGALALGGRALAAASLGLTIVVGVGWSIALGYRDVSLAPRAQLEELEEIGTLVAGRGPTLITEYSPYAARHFLREGEPESISELRRRVVPLRDGSEVPKGDAADTDSIDPEALEHYQRLVIRRGPAQSRPPGEFDSVWIGDVYELWRRLPGVEAVARLPLGDERDPVGIPRCSEVLELAARVGPHGSLWAARRERPVIVPLQRASYPDAWSEAGSPEAPVPSGAGTIAATVDVPRPGRYAVWLGGSLAPHVEARIDGAVIGEQRHELTNRGGYVSFGDARLAAGRHRIELEFAGADLAPGSGATAGPIGPLALDRGDSGVASVVAVEPGEARSRICGNRWDWIEAHRR